MNAPAPVVRGVSFRVGTVSATQRASGADPKQYSPNPFDPSLFDAPLP
jgi:hypothetical protein